MLWKLMAQTLNIGCGSDRWGDVRLDVSRSYLEVQFRPTIIADAQNLPFKEGSFKVTRASHVLEHLVNPSKALKEWLNVTTEKIIISFPTKKDVLPYMVCSFFSLNFRDLLHEYKLRKRRLHKWVIRPEAVTKFLKQHGWKCTVKKGTQCIFNVLEFGKKSTIFQMVNQAFPHST